MLQHEHELVGMRENWLWTLCEKPPQKKGGKKVRRRCWKRISNKALITLKLQSMR